MDSVSIISDSLLNNWEGLNPPPFSFFNEIVVLTVNRPERVEHITQELQYQRIKRVKFFTGFNGFSLSMFELLKEFQNVEKLLVLEDDCYFFQDNQMGRAIEQLPSNWDLLSFGSNLQSDHYKFADNLYCLKDAWMTHAIGYKKGLIKEIIKNFNPETDPINDEWLRLNIYPKYNCFMTNPISAWQIPCYSEINKAEVNYMEHLRLSRKYML